MRKASTRRSQGNYNRGFVDNERVSKQSTLDSSVMSTFRCDYYYILQSEFYLLLFRPEALHCLNTSCGTVPVPNKQNPKLVFVDHEAQPSFVDVSTDDSFDKISL